MQKIDFKAIRQVIAKFELSSRVEPNEPISLDRAFLPTGHRGVLDLRRQLVVGNRGMGKSFWTHALLNDTLREKLADFYNYANLRQTIVMVGFNGSAKVGEIAPTTEEIASFNSRLESPEKIWRAVFLRAAFSQLGDTATRSLTQTIDALNADPSLYSSTLSRLDDQLVAKKQSLLIVFDALDRLGQDWGSIRRHSKVLLSLAVGLQSFSAIRVKIFMRVDQFSDQELFRFPDSSKIRNDHVNLIWQPSELYALLLFEILRDESSGDSLRAVAESVGATHALPSLGVDSAASSNEQANLIEAIAGEFMGSNKKRGRVYTWIPLHLSDAQGTCSPRSFLIAWKKAAEHLPAPATGSLDHVGLIDGVRSASKSRLEELYEDYPWIQVALLALKRQFIPIEKSQLMALWRSKNVSSEITRASQSIPTNAPVGFALGDELNALLEAMKNVAVMEERSNGKINVPDIFRVEAAILRKGGVAVPQKK